MIRIRAYDISGLPLSKNPYLNDAYNGIRKDIFSAVTNNMIKLYYNDENIRVWENNANRIIIQLISYDIDQYLPGSLSEEQMNLIRLALIQ